MERPSSVWGHLDRRSSLGDPSGHLARVGQGEGGGGLPSAIPPDALDVGFHEQLVIGLVVRPINSLTYSWEARRSGGREKILGLQPVHEIPEILSSELPLERRGCCLVAPLEGE